MDSKTVRHIARLARIALEDEQVAPMADELNGILGWIARLKDVDVSGVAPLNSVVAQPLRMRPDVATEANRADAVLANAPQTEDCFFVVPKVVE